MKIFLALNSGEFEKQKIKYRQSWGAFLIFFRHKNERGEDERVRNKIARGEVECGV